MHSNSSTSRIVAINHNGSWLKVSPRGTLTPDSAGWETATLFVTTSSPNGAGVRLHTLMGAQPLSGSDGALRVGEPGGEGDVFQLQLHDASAPLAGDSAAAPAGTLRAVTVPMVSFWDDQEHSRLVRDAFEVLARFRVDGGADRAVAFWSVKAFREALLQGLHDADYKSEYTNNIGPIPTYASHFFDPDTGMNWRGQTSPTAFTEANRFALDAADKALEVLVRKGQGANEQELGDLYSKCGYSLGLALHYLTDLTQPMHAANFINWPLPPWPDWRHSGFETYAETNGPRFRRDPAAVTWSEIDPAARGARNITELLLKTARYSKDVFVSKMRAKLDAKRLVVAGQFVYDSQWGAEADEILGATLPAAVLTASSFLVLWGRMNLAWSELATLPGHSSWAPNFVRHQGRNYFVFTDSDHDYQITFQAMDALPGQGMIVVRNPGDPGSSQTYETPAVASAGGVMCLLWHRRNSRELWTAWSEDLATWKFARLQSAAIKDYTRPSLVAYEQRIHAIWADYGDSMPGTGDRDGLYHAVFDPVSKNWVQAGRMDGKSTRRSPAAAVFGGRLHAAWTGFHDEEGIFHASYATDGGWSGQGSLAGVAARSDRGPGLATTSGVLMLFFRGPEDRIQFSETPDGANWSASSTVPVASAYSHQDIAAVSLGESVLFGWNENWQMKYAIVGEGRPVIDLPDGSLVTEGAGGTVFVICGYAKFGIPSPEVFNSLGYSWSAIRLVPPGTLAFLPSVPADGSFVQELGNDAIWLVVGGKRLWVSTMQELQFLGGAGRFVRLPSGSTTALEGTPRDGTLMKVVARAPLNAGDVPPGDWMVFRMEGGRRRQLKDPTPDILVEARPAPYQAVMNLPAW